MEFTKGNISTIVAMLWTILCPYISQYVTQDAFISICGIIIIVWSACNPNTFEVFGNAIDNTIKQPEYNGDVFDNDAPLNDEYEVDEDGC